MQQGEISPELARRIAILENVDQQGEDFDGRAWLWLLLCGLVVPVVVLLIGWNA